MYNKKILAHKDNLNNIIIKYLGKKINKVIQVEITGQRQVSR